MLNNQRITIIADTVVDDVKIASYGAVLDVATGRLSLTSRYIEEEACKTFKETVRAERNEFEAFAYAIQDVVTGMINTANENEE